MIARRPAAPTAGAALRWLVVAGMMVATACTRTPRHGTTDTTVSESEAAAAAAAPPVVDHHQHLFSPAGVELIRDTSQHPITAARLVGMLDDAGIRRAVVLSEAFWFDSRPAGLKDPGPRVRAENEWTAREAATAPDRLVPFCSFNPLADYAIAELEYCKTAGFRGVKMAFGMAGVDLNDATHIEKVRRVFEAANARGLSLVVHVRDSERYGRKEAETFLTRIVAAAPDVPVQIAHLWGGENFSADALEYYVEAVAAGLPATKNLYFDVAEVAFVAGDSRSDMEAVARSIRRIGIERVVYGSDAAMNGRLTPKDQWALFRARVPLNDDEFRALAGNIAPYLR